MLEPLLWDLDARVNENVTAIGRPVARGRRLIHHSFAESLETQMELEAQAIADQARTQDAREGIAAFIAKRKPEFTGS